MEEHLFYLQRLCRICGEILSRRVTYLVSDHLEELTALYKVHFAGDTSGKEPSSFCNTCYSRVWWPRAAIAKIRLKVLFE